MITRQLYQVISGGQTGVDRAALDAALDAGVPIGGWCPRGRRAEDGPLAPHYPLTESPASEDEERTAWNVRDSDGTLILTCGQPTAGTAFTLEQACAWRKPCRLVNLAQEAWDLDGTAAWLGEQGIRILNIAGPRESTAPGIYARTRDYLRQLFTTMAVGPLARRAKRLARFRDIDLYPVTCAALSAGRSDEEVLDGIIDGGAKIVQLRDKEASKDELYRKAVHFRKVTAAHGVLLMINDHLDIAQAVEADGVHLGQDDLPVTVARRLVPDKLIGASTHSLAEARQAPLDGADEINIGPIFPTKTKGGLSSYLGPAAIREIGPQVTVPFTVMGGINETNLDEVLAAGARRIAVVTAVTRASDIAGAVRALRQRILAARQP